MKVRNVSPIDRSLFQVAAQEYSDPLQWWRIAMANGMVDPDLTGLLQPIAIIIPTQDNSNADGYPEQ